MISPQHSMGDGYARRKCDNCWDGKSTRNCARATRKERMYVWYYFKDGLGHDEKTGRTEEELRHEDFVQIHDGHNPPEKEVGQHGKPY
jgi:hypothetical protein